jgi:hypothetical protein
MGQKATLEKITRRAGSPGADLEALRATLAAAVP